MITHQHLKEAREEALNGKGLMSDRAEILVLIKELEAYAKRLDALIVVAGSGWVLVLALIIRCLLMQ